MGRGEVDPSAPERNGQYSPRQSILRFRHALMTPLEITTPAHSDSTGRSSMNPWRNSMFVSPSRRHTKRVTAAGVEVILGPRDSRLPRGTCAEPRAKGLDIDEVNDVRAEGALGHELALFWTFAFFMLWKSSGSGGVLAS